MTKKVTLGLGNTSDGTSTFGHDGLTGTVPRPFNILIIIVLNSGLKILTPMTYLTLVLMFV